MDRRDATRLGVQKKTNRTPPLPPYPTSAMPGSREKLAVMECRVEQGYQPMHPDDPRDDEMSVGFSSSLALRVDQWQERNDQRLETATEETDATID